MLYYVIIMYTHISGPSKTYFSSKDQGCGINNARDLGLVIDLSRLHFHNYITELEVDQWFSSFTVQ